MILSASRRTDIPCCYPEWMMNRLRKGEVFVRNPFCSSQLSRIPLSPQGIDCIVFWTKDPARFLPYLSEIDRLGYQYYFQFTVTPYDQTIEKNLRDKKEIIQTFITLSKRIGKERVHWRYDPILLNEKFSIAYHRKSFRQLCEHLAPYTDGVTVSFADCYRGLDKNLLREITADEMEELGCMIGAAAKESGISVESCCEAVDLEKYGIRHGSCISRKVLEQLCGCPLALKPHRAQRNGCGCVESIDIGAYHTCGNGCAYCYADGASESAVQKWKTHDSCAPILCGSFQSGETFTEKQVYTLKQEQLYF